MKFRKSNNQEQTARNTRDQAGRSAPVFSYYSNRSSDTSSKAVRSSTPLDTVHLKERPIWLKYAPSLLSLAVVLAATMYLTTLSVQPKIVLTTNPNQPLITQSSAVYESAARSIIESLPSNRSKLTIDTTDVADKLKAQFPELGEVVVTIPLFGRRPIIEAQPATPKLILTGSGGSFVLSGTGVPILRASQLTSAVRDQLPIVTDNSDATIELGKQILTADLVAFISDLHMYFTASDIVTESYTFPALSNEIHAKLAGKGYYIKFNTEAEARLQVGTYIAVQERIESDNTTPAEYIDVRIEERAYIR